MKRVMSICVCVLIVLALSVQVHAQNQQARIYGKVAVILKNGEVRAIAKQRFVVLPVSLWELSIKIRAEATEKLGPEPESPTVEAAPSFSFRGDMKQWREQTARHDEQREDASAKTTIYQLRVTAYRRQRMEEEINKIQAGRVYGFTTEFDGTYQVDVAPGNWFICSPYDPYTSGDGLAVSIGRSIISWAVPVNARSGQQLKLDLSNDNASDITN